YEGSRLAVNAVPPANAADPAPADPAAGTPAGSDPAGAAAPGAAPTAGDPAAAAAGTAAEGATTAAATAGPAAPAASKSADTEEPTPLTGAPKQPELLAGYGESALALENIKLSGGTVTVRGGGIPAGHAVWVAGHPVPVDSKGNFVAEEVLPVGAH